MTTDDLVQRMVERGTLGHCALIGDDGPCSVTCFECRRRTRAALLAALEEMREPSDEMCVKGADATGDWRRDVNADTTAFTTFEVMLSHLIERLKA